MSKKMVVIDYGECRPETCEQGICLAVLACPHKVLRQEAPYEMPDPSPAVCVGCGKCAQVCPYRAVQMV